MYVQRVKSGVDDEQSVEALSELAGLRPADGVEWQEGDPSTPETGVEVVRAASI